TDDTLIYFSKPFSRFNIDINKVKKYLFGGTLIFIIFSVLGEQYQRKQWTIWCETIILLIINNLLLSKYGRVLFEDIYKKHRFIRPDNPYLPSVKSRKTVILFLLCFAFAIGLVLAL
ncbi:MAG: hypothetical protein JW943_10605, partial [Deltaproteobacteria bacterium]|nr:hypothetical protein [Deltaproteobacteria bacterium]